MEHPRAQLRSGRRLRLTHRAKKGRGGVDLGRIASKPYAIGIGGFPGAWEVLGSREPRSRFCGQLSQPEDGCGDGDDGEIVVGSFFEAGGDASELLELAEAACE